MLRRCRPLLNHPIDMTSKLTTGIICTIFLLVAMAANGQKKTSSISFGPSIDFPLNFHDVNKIGYGTSIRGYWGVGKQESILINVYFASFRYSFSSIYNNLEGNTTLSGIKLGYKSYLNSQRLYIYADAGYGYDGGHTGFALGTGPGYSIPLGERGHVDISASSNILFYPIDKTWIDLYFAYRYDLKRK